MCRRYAAMKEIFRKHSNAPDSNSANVLAKRSSQSMDWLAIEMEKNLTGGLHEIR